MQEEGSSSDISVRQGFSNEEEVRSLSYRALQKI